MFARISIIIYLLSSIAGQCLSVKSNEKVDINSILDSWIDGFINYSKTPEFESKIKPLDDFLNDILPDILNMKPNNINGTESRFRNLALNDDSNDDAIYMSVEQLIKRSGFKYEIYDAFSGDGYITQLVRIVNPLADRTRLRSPPLLMMHGGLIDPSAYLIANSIEHFPEPWPQPASKSDNLSDLNRPKSSNRSLAFMLSNQGFDVFLGWTRGANEYDRRHVRKQSIINVLETKAKLNKSIGKVANEIEKQLNYWEFTEDDIIEFEIKSQIDKILEITGCERIALFSYSLSTRTSIGFLSSRPDYARKVAAYICMSPIIAGEQQHGVDRVLIHQLCNIIPDPLGHFVLSNIVLTPTFRSFIISISRPPGIRYMLTKALTTYLTGESAKYRTNLELNVLSHLFMHLSFKQVKQMCQSTLYNKLQKFDYGPVKNLLLYKTIDPPLYDIGNLQIEDYITVSATNDLLATRRTFEYFLNIVNPKPLKSYWAPGFNHLDLFAGFENERYVNKPILDYLISKSIVPIGRGFWGQGKKINGDNLNGEASDILPSRIKLPFFDFKPGNIIEARGQETTTPSSNENKFKLPVIALFRAIPNGANIIGSNNYKSEPASAEKPGLNSSYKIPEIVKQPIKIFEEVGNKMTGLFSDFSKLFLNPGARKVDRNNT